MSQGNIYDKIFKENAERLFLPLVEQKLGIRIVSFTPLREKMQTTLEREVDFMYRIQTDRGEERLLHMEFQSEPEMEMVYRAGEYHAIALRNRLNAL